MRKTLDLRKALLFPALLALTACRTFPPVYNPPDGATDLAPIKFEFSSTYPIVVGEVDIYQGNFQCGQELPAHDRLFVRARGNPLLEDVNLDGTSLPANSPIFLISYAYAGTFGRFCTSAGNFTPRSGGNYLVRLKHEQCSLEVLDVGTDEQAESPDFSLRKCSKSK